jgi:predicted AlkP superfamily pyrophosphatase or phosphodiesterase
MLPAEARAQLGRAVGCPNFQGYPRQMAGRLARALGFLAISAVLTAAVARAWPNLDLAAPLVGELPARDVAAPPEITAPRGVLLVVIDGLRADVAASLPFLSQLARAGGVARTWADPPTYSAAQYVALLAGVPPRDSGVRTNETLRAAGVDDVGRGARAAGLHTAVVSTCVDWWQRLFPNSFETATVVPASRVVSEAARLGTSGGLLVVHLCGVDNAGHAFGARSSEYAAAAAEADRLTSALADAWG